MENPRALETPVSAKPEVKRVELTAADEFVIIGCDGLWDCLSNQEVVGMVRHLLGQIGKSSKDVLTRVARAVANQAGQKTGYHDDITIAIMALHKTAG
mmetsp:Transcript_472/g.847  ORF Transcript_472/g.847 Transcript_472/m.847 type:complete len:98 (-) Transcript_472:67-360(-)